MKRQSLFWSIVICVVYLCGCTSGGGSYQGNYAYHGNYANNSYYRTPVYTQQSQVTEYRSQPVVTPTYSFTDPTATGSGIKETYGKTVQRDRERSINEFLRSCGMWGGTVRDTRDNFKVALGTADRQLAELKRKITLAGGVPETDSRYIAVKANRDRLNGRLQALDNRIMNAIVSKATGDAAKRLVWRDEDRQAASAAMGNLQQAQDRYDAENQRLLNQSY